MNLTTIYRIPRKKLKAIQPDLDYLDQFPRFEFDGVGSDYWAILATKLRLECPAEKEPLIFDEEGGLAIFEWRPTFVKSFCALDKKTLAKAIDDLDNEDGVPGQDRKLAHEAAAKLLAFLGETNGKVDALVEFATF